MSFQAKVALADYEGERAVKKNTPLDMFNPEEPERRPRSRVTPSIMSPVSLPIVNPTDIQLF
jgi:hypothetical protein